MTEEQKFVIVESLSGLKSLDVFVILSPSAFSLSLNPNVKNDVLKIFQKKQADRLKSYEMKEGWMKNDEGWMKNDDDFKPLRVFADRQIYKTDRQTDGH